MDQIQHSKPVPPFVKFCAANIPMVFDDSLSYYEALCALWNWLQTDVIDVINNNATVTQKWREELTEFEGDMTDKFNNLNDAFDTLKTWVETYFDNLDVQEEINNKLDEMVEDGTLMNIISAYLSISPLLCFDTLTEAQSSTNLIAGSTFRTLGKETLNDGYGAYYKVVDSATDIALANNLYAELEDDFGGNNYINEISISNGRTNATDYYLATIPLNDNDGNLIGLSVNEDSTKTPLTYAQDNCTTLTVNAGLTRQSSSNVWKQACVISNGVILHEDLCDVAPAARNVYVGFTADRTPLTFAPDATGSQMLAQGVKNAFMTFGQTVTNGTLTIPDDPDFIVPQVNIGVKSDGTMLIFASDGRTKHDTGFTVRQGAEFMLAQGCINVWRCDGGGSTSLVYKGSKQNRNIDDNATTDRPIYVTLNFKKETIDKELAKVCSFIGKERQLLNKQIRDDISSEFAYKKSFLSLFNWSKTYNVIDTAGTVSYPIQCQDGYRHGSNIEAIRNENNRTVGFRVNNATIVNITITANITMTATNGFRGLRIENANGNTVNDHCTVAADVTSYGANSSYLMTMQCVINNTVAGSEYYFKARGQHNDDFNRITITVEEIGAAV